MPREVAEARDFKKNLGNIKDPEEFLIRYLRSRKLEIIP